MTLIRLLQVLFFFTYTENDSSYLAFKYFLMSFKSRKTYFKLDDRIGSQCEESYIS